MKQNLKHLTPSLEVIKKKLTDEIERLLRDLHNIADEDPSQQGVFIPKPPIHEVETDDDGSVDATTLSDDIPVIENLQQELRDSRKALEAIENGMYGSCKYCGKPIDPKRLEARPTSSACIACKKTLTQEI